MRSFPDSIVSPLRGAAAGWALTVWLLAVTTASAQSVDELIKQLGAPDPMARMMAAGKVGEQGAKAAPAIPALIEAIKCERMEVMFESPQISGSRTQFAQALERIGQPAVPELLKALKDENGLVRVWSALVLWKIDRAKHRAAVVPILIAALREPGEIASDAASICQQMGADAEPAIETLEGLLAHREHTVRCDATLALAAIMRDAQADRLQNALKGDNALRRVGAAFVLQKKSSMLHDTVRQVLSDALADEDADSAQRLAAVWAIGQLGPVAQPLAKPLVAVLPYLDSDPREFFFGGAALGRYTADPSLVLAALGPKAKDDLLPALENERTKVRVMAAVALVRIDRSQAGRVGPIFAAALNDSNEAIRMIAMMNAGPPPGPPGPPAVPPPAPKPGQEPDVEELVKAMMAAPEFGPPSPAVMQLMQRGPAAIEPLMGVLKKGDGLAARRVGFMLASFGPPALKALSEAMESDNEQLRIFAIGPLASMGPPAIPVLIKALDDESYPVRRSARLALKSVGTPEALDALRKAEEKQ